MNQDDILQTNIETVEDTVPSTQKDNHSVVDEPDVLIIKGKFKFQGSGIYGVWALLINKDYNKDNTLHNIVEFKLFASYFSDIYHMDISESWVSLEEKFNQIQIKNSYAVSITELFRGAFDDRIYNNDTFLSSLITDYKNNKFDAIHKNFESVFVYVHKDRQITMDLQMEELHADDIASIRNSRVVEEKPQIDHEFLSMPTVYIDHEAFSVPASPILAPINDGITADKIKPGMRVWMKLDATSTYGQQWVENFDAFNKEGAITPIIGTVDQVGPVIKHKLDILVTYKSNQYTKFNVEANVKLRLHNPSNHENVIDPLLTNLEKKTTPDNWHILYEDTSFRILVFVGVILFMISIWGVIMIF